MKLLTWLFGLLLAAGLFFILSDILKLPKLATERALLSAARSDKKKLGSLDALLLGWAAKLARFVRLDEYKRDSLATILNSAGIGMTPEAFTMYTFLKPGLLVVGALLCLPVIPILAPVLIALAVMIYFKEARRASDGMAKKRGEIEAELPRFVATLEQELKASRDVLTILENYKSHAGAAFASELGILTADMRSSSYESALTRCSGRVGSPTLTDIIRGLTGVLHGDDGGMYFQMLAHDLKQRELQQLKAQAAKIPSKIRVFSLAMLGCFMLTYIVIIVYEIIHSLGGMF